MKHKLTETCNLAKSIELNIAHTSFLKLRNPTSGYFLSRGLLLNLKKIIQEK